MVDARFLARDEAGRDPDQHRARRAGRRGGADRRAGERPPRRRRASTCSPSSRRPPITRCTDARAPWAGRVVVTPHIGWGDGRGAPPAGRRGDREPARLPRAASAATASTEPRQPLVAHQRDDDRARAAVVAVLAEVDPLPGAEREAPVADRDRHRRADQQRLDVRGHVVGPLGRVLEVGRVLRHRAREPALHVAAHVGIGVLVDRQRRRGVLDEQVRQPDLEAARARAARRRSRS